MEELGEQQNENLGRDLASMDDNMAFRKSPLIWVPQLDGNADETDPIIFINWSWFYPVFLKGEYLREGKPQVSPKQHATFVTHIDTSWNLLCTDRRRQAILTK